MRMARFYLLLCGALCLGFNHGFSQNTAEILLKLKKLNTVGSVLYIAAHPDDENTRLLAYLANEKKVRTAYLSLTRGDGGQNLIGDEQGVALGLIRTHELLQARGIDRAEQYFTRAYDFGYSKNPEETLQLWNRDSILADVVKVIRMYRPDVIICRFPTTGEGGHGHHTASAILAEDAFRLAADEKAFPSSANEYGCWQASSLFWNTFNFGSTNTTSEDQLKIDVGAYNALMGKSYGEIASESRSMHKSQGFGSAKQRGENWEYFKFLKGKNVNSDLFETVDLSWNRLPKGKGIDREIHSIIAKFDLEHPEKSLKALVKLWENMEVLEATDSFSAFWKKRKQEELLKIIEDCSGLWLEAGATDFSYVPGQEMMVTCQAIVRNGGELKWKSYHFWQGKDSLLNVNLERNKLVTFKSKVLVPSSQPYSNPYWLNEKHSIGEFEIQNQNLIGKPINPSSVLVSLPVEIEGKLFEFKRDITYKYTDPVKGEVYRPLEILPVVTVNAESASEMILIEPNGKQSVEIQLNITANKSDIAGELEMPKWEGWTWEEENVSFSLKNKGERKSITLKAVSENTLVQERKVITPIAVVDGVEYNQSIFRIEYDHIPYLFYLAPCEVKVTLIKAQVCDGKVGYLEGAGDKVKESLEQVFSEVKELQTLDIRKSDLSSYKAIVFGVRAYNTIDELQDCHAALMSYVERGGNLIVQYNTNSRVGPLKNKIGPFPFTISRDRVTDENAEVRFLLPNHSILNFPNKLTKEDFDGWIQERGIYFASEVDGAYIMPFGMNDPGEKELTGSTIIGSYGKGHFMYTGLSLFRQLPEGVPGAMKLFINMICIPNINE